MDAILTLVAPPGAKLDPALAAAGAAALRTGGATSVGDPEAFADGRAVDIACAADPWSEAVATAVRQAFADAAVDYAYQAPAPRAKRLLIADMDSTIVTGESLDEMAAAAGVGPQVSEITARAMRGSGSACSPAKMPASSRPPMPVSR